MHAYTTQIFTDTNIGHTTATTHTSFTDVHANMQTQDTSFCFSFIYLFIYLFYCMLDFYFLLFIYLFILSFLLSLPSPSTLSSSHTLYLFWRPLLPI